MTCQIEAKVLKRSVGVDAPPLTTFQLRYPRIIHAELMTHRVFSRNARSSRAVPVARLIEEVMTAPFIPRYWGANQKGMQAGGEHDALVRVPNPDWENGHHEKEAMINIDAWLWARDRAVEAAQAFADAGYHKQICNRLLESFMHIDVVVTTTDLSNWDALRDHDMAEPHIRDLAREMQKMIWWWDKDGGRDTGPDLLKTGEWHTPYAEDVEALEDAIKVSVTRCAQVSYTPFHEAKLTIAEEVARHDALVNARPMHASPAEHQATPDRKVNGLWEKPHLHGNLTGWIQYRKTLAGETA